MSSWSKSTMKRASTAVAPSGVASTGLRSTSVISGKSVTSSETASSVVASALDVDARPAAHAVQHLGRADAVDHVERVVAATTGARRNVTSRRTSTRMPPRPNVTIGPNDGSLMAPMRTSWPSGSICWICTPVIVGVGLVGLGVGDDRVEALGHLVGRAAARRARPWPRSCGGCPGRRSWPPRGSPSRRRRRRPPRPRWPAPRRGPGSRRRRRTFLASGALRALRPSARTPSSTSRTAAWSRVPDWACVTVDIELPLLDRSRAFIGVVRRRAVRRRRLRSAARAPPPGSPGAPAGPRRCARRAAASAGPGRASRTA